MSLRISWTRSAVRDLGGLDKGVARRILAAVERFGETEHGSLRALVNAPHGGSHRLWVGDHRAVLLVEGETVTVLRVLHRREAYR